MTSILRTIASYLTGKPLLVDTRNAEAVKAVQRVLIDAGYQLGTARDDGIYGDRTRRAVAQFQASKGIPDTGRVGPLTAAAMDTLHPAIINSIVAGKTPPWLQTAIDNIGVLEAPGPADNPTILAWAKECGGYIAANYKHDSVPWCKMYVEYCLRRHGLKMNDSLWALDVRKYGTKLSGPAVGAVASKTRSGGGHTFFVIGRDKAGHIIGVGGNQSDSVCRAPFNSSELKYNWPDGYPLPERIGFASLPIVPSAKFSKSEA